MQKFSTAAGGGTLARIMHKFSTASPKALGLTVLRLRRPP